MTVRVRRFTAMWILVAAVVSACGSPTPIGEYADAMSASAEAYVVESQNLSFDYQSSVEDGVRDLVDRGVDDAEEQATELMRRSTVEYLALLLDAMGRYVAELEELDPPSDLRDEHTEYVASVRSVHGAIPQTQAAVGEAADLEAVQRAFVASAFSDGQPRWTATCAALEAAIVDGGATANLRCVRTEVPG
ncbi:MAG: hypothetical protein QNJ71_03645 [Acidimicrobiia bacterium]|nr:hypothetical protein [Acidimicrobiia bacterium]